MAEGEGRPVSDSPGSEETQPGAAVFPAAAPEHAVEGGVADSIGESEPALVQKPADPASETGSAAAHESAYAARPPVDAPRRSKMPALLSVIGLVLIALLGVNLYLMLYPPDRADVPAIQAGLNDLKTRLATLEERPSAAGLLDPVQARLKTLDSGFTQLSADLADTRVKLSGPAAADREAADAAAAKLDALDKRTGEIGQNVADLKQAVDNIPRTDLTPLNGKVADLQTGVDTLKGALSAIPKVDLSPLEARLAALEGRLTPAEGRLAALDDRLKIIGTQLAALDGRIKPIEDALATARVYAAPRAVAAQGVLQAIGEGRPFAPELAALQTLGANESELAALRPVAGGAATRATLAPGFADDRAALVQASAPKLTGTMLDRMMASAQGLVKVRPAGANPGNDPDMIASRIADDIDRNDFPEALAEWNHLPEASRAVTADWADALKKRVAAEAAARSIASAAIAAMAQTQ